MLSSAAITAPNIDIAKSLIAMFGMFIRVFVTPTRNTEMPNKNAKRPKKGRHEQRVMRTSSEKDVANLSDLSIVP